MSSGKPSPLESSKNQSKSNRGLDAEVSEMKSQMEKFKLTNQQYKQEIEKMEAYCERKQAELDRLMEEDKKKKKGASSGKTTIEFLEKMNKISKEIKETRKRWKVITDSIEGHMSESQRNTQRNSENWTEHSVQYPMIESSKEIDILLVKIRVRTAANKIINKYFDPEKLV
ncbi:hypothetical protein L3Y34_015932 [Caenorhabditis briggsae]|uniref:Uncharacterized protein n=1 Tax=Caenorhabditis briggsae TaxID=6238 RepID=A0AAE9J0E9_CAEBR|nr:hypothetical protein L3Y34_015932 [Caenorhabditis briggsae]